MSNVLLHAHAISKRFGGIAALKQVSLSIKRGAIYGLIGPNGAGKTSFFNVITGLYTPDTGHVQFNDQPLPLGIPHAITCAGIARTFQNIRLFTDMTALENVMVGQHARTHSGVLGTVFRTAAMRHEEAHIRSTAHDWLDYVGIGNRAHEPAGCLSYGEQRRLELARALATQPTLLALDEPAAGMNATETAELSALLTQLRQDGLTILLIEHDMPLVMSLCDRVAVLQDGATLAEGPPSDIQRDPRVIEAYLGSDRDVL